MAIGGRNCCSAPPVTDGGAAIAIEFKVSAITDSHLISFITIPWCSLLVKVTGIQFACDDLNESVRRRTDAAVDES